MNNFDKELWRKVLLGVGSVMVIFAVASGVTAGQIIPVLIYVGLALAGLNKKNVKVFMLILAIVMVVINIFYPSWIDVVFWGAVLGLYI